jgi:hypothetical protein
MKKKLLFFTLFFFTLLLGLVFMGANKNTALADSVKVQNPENGYWYQRIV